MSQDQIKWAMSHDWACYPSLCGKGVVCRDNTVDALGYFHTEFVTITDWRTLRLFAGY